MLLRSLRRALRPKVSMPKMYWHRAQMNSVVAMARITPVRYFTSEIKPPFDEDEQAAMIDAKKVMHSLEEAVTDLKSYTDWVPVVMKSKIPVILDCYADWCNPCQKLTPLLEKKAIEAEGKFKLVKVNIDLLPEIANGLNVRSIPAVFLVSNGNVMDTFAGVPSEERLNDFINTAKLLDALSHDERTIDNVIIAGEEHVKSEGRNGIFMLM